MRCHEIGHGASRRCPAWKLWALVPTMLAGLLVPSHGEAQGLGWGSTGFLVGTVAGGWSAMGAIVARARLGSYTFDLGDVRIVSLETLPALSLPIAGAWLGASSSDRLVSATAGSGIGLVGGGLVGWGLGSLVSDDTESRWAGAIMGSAAGALVGAVVGGLRTPSEEAPGPAGASPGAVPIVLSFPLGGPR